MSNLADFIPGLTETNDLTSAVTWANIPDVNVPASAVTQHQNTLTVTESQISDLGTYQTTSGLNAAVDSHLNQSNPTSGYVLSWNGSDYAWVTNAGGGGLTDVIDDTTPQLGGNLDLNGSHLTNSQGNTTGQLKLMQAGAKAWIEMDHSTWTHSTDWNASGQGSIKIPAFSLYNIIGAATSSTGSGPQWGIKADYSRLVNFNDSNRIGHLRFEAGGNMGQNVGDDWVDMVYHTGGTSNKIYEFRKDGLRLHGFTLPNADGSVDQVLKTDGSGNVTWQSSISTEVNAVNSKAATSGLQTLDCTTKTHHYMNANGNIDVRGSNWQPGVMYTFLVENTSAGSITVDLQTDTGNSFASVTLPAGRGLLSKISSFGTSSDAIIIVSEEVIMSAYWNTATI